MSVVTRRRGDQSRPRFVIPTLPTTNLFARFIAGTGETTASGKLTAWADQSGGGNNAAPTGANGPYAVNDHKGRRVVRFVAADTIGMSFAAAHSFNARNISVFLAARIMTPTNKSIFGLLNYAGNAAHMRFTGSPGGYFVTSRDATIKPQMNPIMLGFTSGTTAAAYSQYKTTTGLTAVTTDTDCAGATLGVYNASTNYADMDVYEVAVYEGIPTGTDITNITNYFTNKYQIRATDYRKQVTFEGDSITAGSGAVQLQSYPLQTLRRGNEDWRMTNLAISGSTIATMSTRGTAVDTMIESGYQRNVLFVLIGRNDAPTRTAQQIFDDLTTYVTARVTAGWEVWAATLIASSSTLQPTIDAANAKIRGTDGPGIIASAGASKLVDFAAIPQFADFTAAGNTTYYQGDSTHPTVAGATILADTVSALLGAY